MKNFFKITILISTLLILSCKQSPPVISTEKSTAAISIEGLQNRTYEATVNFEKELQKSKSYISDLMSYYSDSLKIYALVNTPTTQKPKKGYPILIFGHGFHPEPKKYGVSTTTGKDWRPGDYYRGIPEAYAERGFLAITPDYRGHNISEGFDYTKTSYLASTYYAIDVLHLIAALPSLENADLDKIYFMGHSMGGDVGLKMLLATDKIKAASLWSSVSASTVEQAIYYGKMNDEKWDSITPNSMKTYLTSFDASIKDLGFEYDVNNEDPINFIDEISTPLIIHHSTKETSVPYRWSESLAAKLYKYKKTFEFYSYKSENHLFQGENRIKAVERDLRFFSNH